jgi:hypothetical protein
MTLRFAGFARHLSIFFMPNRTVNQECPQRVIFNISVCSRRQQNVRYGRPKSDQIDASQRTAASCQLRLNATQQTTPYSITSSARSRMAVGTSRPSVLAVFRLTTSSNLAGC